MATEGVSISPSVARSLSLLEQRDLAAIALGLPSTWCVQIEPPFGQLAITPKAGRRRYHRAWVADPATRRIARDDGLPGLRRSFDRTTLW